MTHCVLKRHVKGQFTLMFQYLVSRDAYESDDL